jgi:hypothetical protein
MPQIREMKPRAKSARRRLLFIATMDIGIQSVSTVRRSGKTALLSFE